MAAYCSGIRICILNRWTSVQGWGFTLHSAPNRRGARYITAVKPYSPAACTGLRPGDRIVEVNYENICGVEHDEVIRIIQSCEDTMMLLVVDAPTDIAYQNMQKCIHSHLPSILILTCPKTETDGHADVKLKLSPQDSSSVGYTSLKSLTSSSTSGEYYVQDAAQRGVDSNPSADSISVGYTSLKSLTSSSTSGEYYVQDGAQRGVDSHTSADSLSVGCTSLKSLTSSSTSGEYYVQDAAQRGVDSHPSADSLSVGCTPLESIKSSLKSGEISLRTLRHVIAVPFRQKTALESVTPRSRAVRRSASTSLRGEACRKVVVLPTSGQEPKCARALRDLGADRFDRKHRKVKSDSDVTNDLLATIHKK